MTRHLHVANERDRLDAAVALAQHELDSYEAFLLFVSRHMTEDQTLGEALAAMTPEDRAECIRLGIEAGVMTR